MNWIPFRYLLAFTPAVAAWISFHSSGVAAWTTVWVVFGIIPLVELIVASGGWFGQDDSCENTASNVFYTLVLYLSLPIQFGMMFEFVTAAVPQSVTSFDLFGRIVSMGILCGTYGINVAHELGHRSGKFDQFLAKVLLLTSQYMHFFIEHNRGHHKFVGTPEDPSTARKNEIIYTFIVRSMCQVWLSAWRIEFQRLERLGQSKISFKNEMLRFQVYQLLYLVVLCYFFGGKVAFCAWLAAFIGAALLETINYIEHYGLSRKKMSNGLYEHVTYNHSWNSNHIVGRLLLFELSRHSDHHAKTLKKYQELRNSLQAPQMPTGYPGMMVLSYLPPLFFRVVNPRIPASSLD